MKGKVSEHLCARLPVNFTGRVIGTNASVRKSGGVADASRAGHPGRDGTRPCGRANGAPRHPACPADRPSAETFLRELGQDVRNVSVGERFQSTEISHGPRSPSEPWRTPGLAELGGKDRAGRKPSAPAGARFESGEGEKAASGEQTGGTGHSRFQSSAFLLRKCPGVKNAPRKPEGHDALVPAALERSIHLCEDKNVELSPNFS